MTAAKAERVNAHARRLAESAPGERGGLISRLSLLDRIAIVAIGLQFIAMAALSILLWHRHGLTGDFAGFFHAWSAIAHGDLNPMHQDNENMRYIQNHGEIITWVLAPLYWLLPNPLSLRLVQDVSALGCSILAYLWTRGSIAELGDEMRRTGLFIGITVVVLIAANPWPIWANAFDFHWQATGAFFILAAAYAFRRRRLAWGFAACVFAIFTGDVIATILVGLGLSMLFIPGVRVAGAGVAILAFAGYATIHHLGGGIGYAIAGQGLEGIYGQMFLPDHPHGVTAVAMATWMLTHPLNVLGVLLRNAKEIYANVAPSGIIGIAYPWAWGVCLITLLENNLADGNLFAQPSFQSFPLYAFVPIGTGAFLLAIARRVPPSVTYAVCGVLVLNVAAWAAVWLPHVPSRWVLVRPAAAAELTRVNDAIPRNEEVIAGEAFLGLFADRPSYYSSIHPSFKIDTRPFSVVIAPYDGINALSPNADLSRIAALAKDGHAKLVSHRDGVWWFSYTPASADQRKIDLPFGADVIPAWSLDGISGKATIEGPPSTWRMEYDHMKGDVLSDDYWRVPPGSYEAIAEIEASEPVIFEIRNASGNAVILRTELPQRAGRNTYRIPFQHAFEYVDDPYSGWGPFQYDPIPFPDNAIELRIWSPGTGKLSIYNIGIAPLRDRPRTIVH